jgi:dienelactone hydrolase
MIQIVSLRRSLLLGAIFAAPFLAIGASKLPERDERAAAPQTLDTARTFPEISSRSQWEQRAREIHERVLTSCGLWPLPAKSPLKAVIFDRVERDGYSVEKAYFQSYPGFYVAGNLYRPLGKGKGPFPGVLNPHGHWAQGRLNDTTEGSIAARCISFARQGMVAFSWDMTGYNDMMQLGPHRQIATNRVNQLWSISLMGLQTWNSIRAVDFLESLPDIDKKRLACTGESGGGTQTFMLGAADSRLAAQAPVVMVSHSMQGGCLCENAPGLRIDYSNMEIAAVPAPRPQILVAASGDWTKTTMTIEGPSIEKIYQLFGSANHLRYVRFEFDHNYNQTSREAVYGFFDKWLLKGPGANAVGELPYQKEPNEKLLVWQDRKMPSDALNESQLLAQLIKSSREQLAALTPRNRKTMDSFNDNFMPLWKETLDIDLPEGDPVVERDVEKKAGKYNATTLAIGRPGKHDRLPVVMITSPADRYAVLCLLVHPKGKAAYLDRNGEPQGLARELLDRKHTVMLMDTFLTGELADEKASAVRKPFSSFFTTYNRTDLQERVQDIITVCALGQRLSKGRQVVVFGEGAAGLWALLAAPAASGVVADCNALDDSDDQVLLTKDYFVPGLRKMGGFQTAAALAAPRPILAYNTGSKFSTDVIRAAYKAVSATPRFEAKSEKLSDAEVAEWIGKFKQ